MFFKIISIIFNFYLKLRYLNRLKLDGLIFIEGLVSIKIEKGANLVILGNISIRKGSQIIIRKNSFCQIGKGTFFNRNCSLVCRDKVVIGEEVLFGESVKIYDNDHFFDEEKIYKDKFITNEVMIKDYSWIGNDVNILKGTIIPENSIIGSMSLVKSRLATSGIYVGTPVKLLKSR